VAVADDIAPKDDTEQPNGGSPAEPPDGPGCGQIVGGVFILVGLLVLVIGLVLGLAPDDVPTKKNPGFIDNIFDSPVVIAAARIVLLSGAVVLLFGGLYIVASVLVRMGRQEWLRRAGWFESQVGEEVEEGLEQAEWAFDRWLEALEENEQLEERLAERDEAIETLLEQRELLVEELSRRPEA
jgi:hypothetical protein